LVQRFGISVGRAAHLVDAYGTRAREVMAFCADRSDDWPLGPGTELTAAEIAFLTQFEYVARLDDLIMRRTAIAITGAVDTGLIEAISVVAAGELGWSDARRRSEIDGLV